MDKADKKKPKKALAKIAPVASENDSNDDRFQSKAEGLATEKAMIQALHLLLREFGIRKSGAAIRDSADSQYKDIGPKEAVAILSNLGFKSSFGSLKIKTLTEEFFPLIAFKKNGEAVLALSPPSDEKIALVEPISQKKLEVTIAEFNSNYSSYFIIVKQLSSREKEEQSGHWFSVLFEKASGSTFE